MSSTLKIPQIFRVILKYARTLTLEFHLINLKVKLRRKKFPSSKNPRLFHSYVHVSHMIDLPFSRHLIQALSLSSALWRCASRSINFRAMTSSCWLRSSACTMWAEINVASGLFYCRAAQQWKSSGVQWKRSSRKPNQSIFVTVLLFIYIHSRCCHYRYALSKLMTLALTRFSHHLILWSGCAGLFFWCWERAGMEIQGVSAGTSTFISCWNGSD